MTGLVGCGESAVQPAGPDVQLTETIPKAMEQAAIPGAIVGVWQDDAAPYVQAFGVRDTATGDPMAPDLFMRIGSVTKTFTTTAVLQLVDQGKVGLDDPIDRYVPGVPNGDTITIRQLAAMRSGLPDYTDVVIPALPSQPQRQWTPQELLEISFSRPPLFAPGAEFDYCNTNTTLLGLVVEKASGQQLDTYIAEHITRPENLDHTSVPTSAAFPSPHAQGYTKTPDGATVDATDWNPSWGFGAGNMISTLDDLRVWARDLAEGTLLSPATQREREQFQLAPSEGTGSLYGLGVEYQNGWIGHNGNIAGYQTYAYYLPPEGKTVVVLVNSNVDPLGVWNFFAEIVRIISPDHPWPAPPS
ncbi:MAG: class A beta-lactamase-related serine hydrolase [Rhodococcus sp. (in: high G+C Gram-positive bacteria)]|nr:MAG: class A beta-lactamase-related serine hydrolase [Rhodococcus sp. (in: high G+C Gram-positive bacteria)]